MQGKVVVITGAAQGLGRCMAETFTKAGARVCTIDIQPGCDVQGDIAQEEVLKDFAQWVVERHGHVDCLINNAKPALMGIDACSFEDFNQVLKVGITAPFYLSKLFAPYFAPGGAIVNICSARYRMSQPQSESYAAAKGGIAALTHALAMSLAGRVRVNAISPGWIDVAEQPLSLADHAQQPVGHVGKPEDIANLALFLCSDKASFITGENITIDGGMTRQMIYHGEHGWSFQPL